MSDSTNKSKTNEERGYQPKPKTTFGYQPAQNSTPIPTPPKTGSDVKSSKND